MAWFMGCNVAENGMHLAKFQSNQISSMSIIIIIIITGFPPIAVCMRMKWVGVSE